MVNRPGFVFDMRIPALFACIFRFGLFCGIIAKDRLMKRLIDNLPSNALNDGNHSADSI